MIFQKTSARSLRLHLSPNESHPRSEVFLNQIEKQLFELAESPLNYSNFSEEWQAMSSLVNDRSVVIKKAGKGSCVVVWGSEDYIAEAERQLGDVTVHKDVSFKEKLLQDLAETSNKLFRKLKNREGITEKELKYFNTIPPGGGAQRSRATFNFLSS